MDVNTVLRDTLSPDTQTRTNAEQQLQHAANQDLPQYLRTLAQELANDQADTMVRMAAGLVLKNALTAREFMRLKELQQRWIDQVPQDVKQQVKQFALHGLKSSDARVGTQAAQFLASIAAIEIPRAEWPELMQGLVQNVQEGSDQLKQSSLMAIGFICENEDPSLRTSLSSYSNAILTAVVQGARKDEPNNDIRNAAITALSDSLEFVRSNFENEGERNYIMQVVCEATQAEDSRIVQGAYGCLNRIMNLYYDKMLFYMEKALFGLTIQGMNNEEEEVAKLAIEFWCTVCEEEISIEDDNAQADMEGIPARTFHNFAVIATQEVIPVLLKLLCNQDEDATDDEYNVPRAAYQCLTLWSQAVGTGVVQPVLAFIEANIHHENWQNRDAAVSAFGAIMDGPDEKMLDNIVKQGLPVLVSMMSDSSLQVRDSAAFTLGRISECASQSIDPEQHLRPLVEALFNGLTSNPKMAGSCCWALMSLVQHFTSLESQEENAMTPYFDASCQALLSATERTDMDQANTRLAAYEVLVCFITEAANKSVPTVANISNIILERLRSTVPLRSQVVSVEDKLILDDMQSSLSTVIMAIIHRLEGDIRPQADPIMSVLLEILNGLGPQSSVADTVFHAIGALSQSLEEDFMKYMQSFNPFLLKAVNNRDEPQLCSVAIGVVCDVVRALGPQARPYTDDYMNSLLENLRSTALNNSLKPAILSGFGDIAQAVGGEFETYLSVVAQVLEQASSINWEQSVSFDMMDYILSLREGILEAWIGAIIAMKTSNKAQLLQPYTGNMFNLLNMVANDSNRTENLLKAAMGVIGDLADAFPNGELASYFNQMPITNLIKETKSNREFSSVTTDTARYAREQIRRQNQGGGQEGQFAA